MRKISLGLFLVVTLTACPRQADVQEAMGDGQRGMMGDGQRGMMGDGQRGMMGDGQREMMGMMSAEMHERMALMHRELAECLQAGRPDTECQQIMQREHKKMQDMMQHRDREHQPE